jgi:hypothetical protein
MTDSSAPPPPSERRHGARHIACFPAYVESPSGDRDTAMIADLSVSGALLYLRHRPDVDIAVRLELFISLESGDARVTTGKIVRVEPLPENRVSPWFFSAAVHFDAPLTIYKAEIDAMMERLGKLGLKR